MTRKLFASNLAQSRPTNRPCSTLYLSELRQKMRQLWRWQRHWPDLTQKVKVRFRIDYRKSGRSVDLTISLLILQNPILRLERGSTTQRCHGVAAHRAILPSPGRRRWRTPEQDGMMKINSANQRKTRDKVAEHNTKIMKVLMLSFWRISYNFSCPSCLCQMLVYFTERNSAVSGFLPHQRQSEKQDIHPLRSMCPRNFWSLWYEDSYVALQPNLLSGQHTVS